MSPKNDEGRGSVRSYGDWMSQLPPQLHSVPLFNLAIPGSHDSMSYDLDVNSSIIEPDRLKRFSKIVCLRYIMHRWAVTQEVTIIQQLDAGVRYFDLRIARKPNDTHQNRLYFCHGLYTRTDVETVLKDIHEWTEKHPKEIVILCLSSFLGFDKENRDRLHSHLINFIKTLFQNKLINRSGEPTLRSCWAQRRNVIVSYDYSIQHPELWGKIRYYYGNSMNAAEVESNLRLALETKTPSKGFFVCGLNLTLPNDVRILKYVLRLCDNFPNVIQRSLPKLLKWIKKQAEKTSINIIASDLVTRDDFVSTVIKFNE